MSNDLPKPDHATSNLKLVGYSDQGGRCDGVQIMVHQGFAYVGHIFSKGFSVIDVRDPRIEDRQICLSAAQHVDAPFAGGGGQASCHS